MPRPTKQGIDYFPMDCQFDDKIELYLLESESDGLSVLVTLWQLIYHNEGYYIVNNKDLHLLVKKRINVDINTVNDCINICLKRGIFDESLHKKHKILTSKAIQKRYFDAAKRKKGVRYSIDYIIKGINVSENAINVIQQSLNVKEDVKVKGKVKGKKLLLAPLQLSWNSVCSNLSKVGGNSKVRQQKERLRLKERDSEKWIEVFTIINNSAFCCGENYRGWKASYDWIMSNDTNALKVLEGKYDGNPNKPKFDIEAGLKEQERIMNEE